MANKETKLSLTGIVDDITFSKKDVWVWVKLPDQPYEFLDATERERLSITIDVGLAALISSEEKSIECQMIVTSTPFDTRDWVRKLFDRSNENGPSYYLETFLTEMYHHVEDMDFRERQVFLGLNLGKRADYKSTGAKLGIKDLTNAFEGMLQINDPSISEAELKFWRERANNYKRTLMGGNLRAIPVRSEEIAYIVKKAFYPNMPVPQVDFTEKQEWGAGELDLLVDADITNNPKYLEIRQDINGYNARGYRATLCFARFPETMYFPQREPWIHFSALLPFTTDFYSRFTLEPSRKVAKEVGRKIKEIQDQADNMTSAGGSLNIDIQERMDKGLELDYALNKTRNPWVFGRHRITIEAGTVEELKNNAQMLIDHYKNLDIQVVWSTGDQLDLLMESMPNDTVRLQSYYQRQELSIISAGMPTGSSFVGDKIVRENDGRVLGWVGPYMGYTTARVRTPVFLSVHSAIAKNNPPGLIITGAPGGGKSFMAFTLTYLMSLMGTWTIYIDPKGDAIPMAKLKGVESTRLFDLRQGNDGMLDPFSIGQTSSERKDLALETINLFLGGSQRISPKQNIEISKAIQEIAKESKPSLNKVVDYLLNANNDEAQGIGHTLNLIRDLPFARLCFAAKEQDSIRPDEGMTIITLLGLDLPSSATPPEVYTNSNRLAVSVMYLLTNFTRQLMMSLNKSHPKAIVIDEAWAVTATPQGLKLVLEVARMGRSLNTGLVLVSQNAGDFQGEGITNSVATKVAFRAKTPDEIDNILKFFALELNDMNRDIIRELNNGECLIQDADGRTSRVQIDPWNQNMQLAFETNPETRKSNEQDLS